MPLFDISIQSDLIETIISGSCLGVGILTVTMNTYPNICYNSPTYYRLESPKSDKVEITYIDKITNNPMNVNAKLVLVTAHRILDKTALVQNHRAQQNLSAFGP